ncbi:MAG TPA: ATP-binding protein, partial [Steroidobacteraceae bacterium]|nr:ATP-binding protein [Steroidobacteraceae bacterium]
ALQLAVVSTGRGGSEVAYGLISDPRGGMWISGNAGLLYLDPDSGATRVYHREDGLQGEEFSFGAYFRLRDGRVCFGGPGGFNIFDPRRIYESRQPPGLLLTHIDVLGVPAKGDTPFWTRQALVLDHRASIVSLDFAVLDYATPEHSRLSYRLPALSEQWIDLGAQRRVTLTNLPAGNHVLEVRAAGADSPWSAEPLRFSIHRDPAPWRTPWAYALYASLLGALITFRVVREHQKLRAMQRTQEYLESQVAARTIELVDSNQRLAEAARAKSDFLDRMSHELRTPMNGVVGMTELLTRTVLTPAQAQLTRTISASAHILLRIVNDLLDLSKIRAGKVELERSPIDLCQMLEECASLFAAAAETKGLKLVVCPPAQWHRAVLGDPLRLRQILMNLIGNAMKFTASGEIVLRADVEPAGEGKAAVRLSVTDTGIGIEEAVLARVFDPFTQADEKTTRQYGGTGLGLSICRELAGVMGGEIIVKSRPQVGSTFCLQLPMPIGAALEAGAVMPSVPVQLCTHSPALAESLQRFCGILGVAQVGYDASIVEPHTVQIVDASTDGERLSGLLAGPVANRARLVVVATSQEVETLGLRVLLREGLVITRPVLRQALREALATATGTGSGATHRPPVAQQFTRLRGSVLLVEDDPVNAAVAEGYLAETGCRCTSVSSATAAISLAQTQRFDLVLMDLNMPDMDGLAATARLREAEAQRGDARTPIIALTAHEAHSYRERVLRAGMDDILSKPCTLQEFHALLARWLSGRPLPAPVAVAEVCAPPDAALSAVDISAVQVIAGMGTGGSAGLFQKLVGLFATSSRP